MTSQAIDQSSQLAIPGSVQLVEGIGKETVTLGDMTFEMGRVAVFGRVFSVLRPDGTPEKQLQILFTQRLYNPARSLVTSTIAKSTKLDSLGLKIYPLNTRTEESTPLPHHFETLAIDPVKAEDQLVKYNGQWIAFWVGSEPDKAKISYGYAMATMIDMTPGADAVFKVHRLISSKVKEEDYYIDEMKVLEGTHIRLAFPGELLEARKNILKGTQKLEGYFSGEDDSEIYGHAVHLMNGTIFSTPESDAKRLAWIKKNMPFPHSL